MSAPIGKLDFSACKDCSHMTEETGCDTDPREWIDNLVADKDDDQVRCGLWEQAA